MIYYLICLGVFLLGYLVNIAYISVFYHRGLTHGALTMSPSLKRLVVATGNWVTGLDPKGWSTMHRLHHRHSDTPKDPHSPVHSGFFGTAMAQLNGYKRTLKGLIRKEKAYTSISSDFDFDVSWLNKKGLWYLPYVFHGAISLAMGLMGAWLLGFAYFAGIMSHPIQGWMVNSMGHALGYRNFETSDNSRNNTLVAWLVAGEGFQNNHHRYPQSVKFSLKWFEFDWGFLMASILRFFGLVAFDRNNERQLSTGPERWETANS